MSSRGRAYTPPPPELEHQVVVPPDGGYGWLILICAFLCTLIADGVAYSFGLFISDLSQSFNATIGGISFVSSVSNSAFYLTGPLASALVNRAGFRPVAISGGMIATAGYALTVIGNKHWHLIITNGLMVGVGLGLVYVPTVVIVGFYFERWRALATGVMSCGSGIGTMLLPPILQFVRDKYNWKASYFILAGTVFLLVPISMFYRSPRPLRLPVNSDEELDILTDEDIDADTVEEGCCASCRMHHNAHYPTTAAVASIPRGAPLRVSSGSDVFIWRTRTRPNLSISRATIRQLRSERRICCARRVQSARPLYRDDIFFGQSLMLLPQYRDAVLEDGDVEGGGGDGPRRLPAPSVEERRRARQARLHARRRSYHMSVTRVATARDVYGDEGWRCLCPAAVTRTLSTMLDWGLLGSLSFQLFSWSGLFAVNGYLIPYVFVVERATHQGLSPSAAQWLIPAAGAANTVGRILCGALPFLPGFSVIEYSAISTAVAGIAVALSGLSSSLRYQVICMVVFGVSGACIATLRPLIVVELFGLENLTNAFGLQLMFMGIACFAGISLAGYLHDVTNTYEPMFYMSACSLIMCALCLAFLKPAWRWRKRRWITRALTI